ncbi:MAG: CarD family transcriptional regulator [Lachnospiraceae bacterium]
MSYKVNETILYGTHGVCRITEISERKFGEESMEYYILKPLYDKKSTLFVPANSEKLLKKMRRVLTVEEIYDLIKAMPDQNTIWIENESERKDKYKEILSKGNRKDLVCLIKTLYKHQLEQQEKGKKLHIADERFMKDAEHLLHAEFAHVLEIQYEQVVPFILQELQLKERKQLI